jgi:hypothetical protein
LKLEASKVPAETYGIIYPLYPIRQLSARQQREPASGELQRKETGMQNLSAFPNFSASLRPSWITAPLNP